MKKGQGLSLNTIIIAAIVLIVLVVLWAIFTGRMGMFSGGLAKTNSCEDACKALGWPGDPDDSTEEFCKEPDGKYLGKNFYDAEKKQNIVSGCCCRKE